MSKMNFCVSANSKYARYLYVMLLSLFENNKEEDIRVFVLQRDFTDADKFSIKELGDHYHAQIEYVKINEEEFRVFPITAHFSMETYFRFKIPDLIPADVDRLLYLDVDVTVRGSLRELFDLDLDGYYFAACSDIVVEQLVPTKRRLFKRFDDLRYFNAGILMWNLNEVRGKINIKDFVKAGNELNYNLPHVDQDLLNYLYYDKTLYLDPYVYNYLVVDQLFHPENGPEKAKILHFCWYNPWQPGPKTDTYREWWKYAEKSPFYTDFLAEQLERSEELIYETHKAKTSDAFRDTHLYEISECMFDLKGNGNVNRFAEAEKCSLIIYGAGYWGKKTLKLLESDGLCEKIEAVYDRKQEGNLETIPITNDLERLKEHNNCVIIVTPVNEPEKIADGLSGLISGSTKIMTLLDFLMEVSKY